MQKDGIEKNDFEIIRFELLVRSDIIIKKYKLFQKIITLWCSRQVGKARVCKTLMREFKSRLHLQKY
jgi:hypothetical protein